MMAAPARATMGIRAWAMAERSRIVVCRFEPKRGLGSRSGRAGRSGIRCAARGAAAAPAAPSSPACGCRPIRRPFPGAAGIGAAAGPRGLLRCAARGVVLLGLGLVLGLGLLSGLGLVLGLGLLSGLGLVLGLV